MRVTNLSEVLDAVEHSHETFRITRGGRPVARPVPAEAASGRAAKDLLLRHKARWRVGGRPRRDQVAARDRGAGLDRLVLDTTILVSAEREANRLERAIADDDDVAIAAVTAVELLVGVELAAPRRRAKRPAFVQDVLVTLTVEEYTLVTARAHAHLLAAARTTGRPRGAHELIIAATAFETGRTVITADARAFKDLPGVAVRIV